MSCGIRLDEFLDGELAEADRRSVEAHLEGCAACRAETDGLRKLEGILRAVPRGTIPDADRFLGRVRARSRSAGRAWMAVAAAVLLGVTALLAWPPAAADPDLAAGFQAYLRHPSDEIEAGFRSAGARALPVLEPALDDRDERVRFAAAGLLLKTASRSKEPALEAAAGRVRFRYRDPAAFATLEAAMSAPDIRHQFAAAQLLFMVADGASVDRLVVRHAAKAEPSPLILEAGADPSDIEMLPVAVSALQVGGQERWAMDVLRKLHWLNLEAKKQVIASVVMLLKQDNPRVQELALEIVKELDIEFPLASVVDLLDSPELGEKVLPILRKATSRDYGKDKAAWLKAVQ